MAGMASPELLAHVLRERDATVGVAGADPRGQEIRTATDCSGLDTPIHAMKMMGFTVQHEILALNSTYFHSVLISR